MTRVSWNVTSLNTEGGQGSVLLSGSGTHKEFAALMESQLPALLDLAKLDLDAEDQAEGIAPALDFTVQLIEVAA
jgi:hypothetical protein